MEKYSIQKRARGTERKWGRSPAESKKRAKEGEPVVAPANGWGRFWGKWQQDVS